MSDRRPIRVFLQHFALPAYRIPVFAELAASGDLEIEVAYGTATGLGNVEARGFVAHPSRVHRVDTPAGYLLWDRSQWQGAKRGTCDVLMMSWNPRSLSLLPALWRARRNGIATLLWGHGYSRRESALRRRLRHTAAARADGVVFYTDRTAARYTEATGRRRGVFVARNAIDQRPIAAARETWLSRPGALESFREAHRISGPLVLFVSRHKPANRTELLVEACAMLRERQRNLVLALVGPGLDESAAIRSAVEAAGLEEAVRFVGPIYEELEIAPWFLSADVFAYPSNLGLSVLHAFGYGLPVVTGSDEAANPPEWAAIEDGGNGLLCEPGSAPALAEAIERVIGDPELRGRLSTGALATVQETFTLDAMVDGLRSAIRYAAARSAGLG